MIKNYLKIALRNLFKNKVDSAISIVGLSVGITCCILLLVYTRMELTYDEFHEDRDQVYRLTNTSVYNPEIGEQGFLSFSYPLASEVESAFPQVEHVVRMTKEVVQIQIADKRVNEEVIFADEGFFDVFTFPLQQGGQATALKAPNNVVISQRMADRLFDQGQIIGESISFFMNGEEYVYQVAGVAVNPPNNSSLKFDILFPMEAYFNTLRKGDREIYRNTYSVGFVEIWLKMKEGVSIDGMEASLPGFARTHLERQVEQTKLKLGLQPFSTAYFDEFFTSYLFEGGNRSYSLILGGIAIVILLIAGINFMSLTLGRSTSRVQEIGIRITNGATRKQITRQFVGEAFITCTFSFLLAIVLTELLLPFFQQMTQKPIAQTIFYDPIIWLSFGAIVVLLTLITGGYPAIVIPRQTNLGTLSMGRVAQRVPLLVKTLIVVQFGLSITFMLVAFTMQKQLNYVLNQDLGYSSENVIAIAVNENSIQKNEKAKEFVRRARQLANVQQATVSRGSFSQNVEYGMLSTITSYTTKDGEGLMVNIESGDTFYTDLFGFEFKEGRGFSPEDNTSQKRLIVNERFVKESGIENPIGHTISDKNNSWNSAFNDHTIIGVIEDYNFKSLFSPITPLAISHIDTEEYLTIGTIYVRLHQASEQEAIAELNNIWGNVFEFEEFNYSYLDELERQQYAKETRWNLIMKAASAISVLLACFGLFGLISLAAQKRTQEIGIRKVMGATITHIVTLLSKDFIFLVGIGFLIASPLAWYIISEWLADFVYKIEVGVDLFLIVGSMAVVLALMSVSWQSIKAATANPVDSLRSE